MPSYRALIEPNLIVQGRAIALWHDPLDDGRSFWAADEAKGIEARTFTDFLRQVKGELPAGPAWEAFRVINSVGTVFLRTVVMRPGSPPDAVEAMRKAFTALSSDPEYAADAMRTVKYVPRYLADEATAQLYLQKLRPEPAVREFLRDYVAKGRESAGKQ